MKRVRFLQQLILGTIGFSMVSKAFNPKPNNHLNGMNKRIIKKTELNFKQAFPGLKGVDMMAHTYPIEPFLVFTEFLMEKPVFGPHPHAGISVMTYLLPDSKESFINRDSQGDFSFIEPGGMHIMQAGSGMHHDEFPKVTGHETHGFQIWINHADKDRMVSPKSMHAAAAEIPEISNEDYKVRIVHGQFQGKSPAYQMVTDVNLLHIYLEPGRSIQLEAQEMAFVYGLGGNAMIENEKIQAQNLINFSSEGTQIKVTAGDSRFEFMFGSGTPHHEPITYGGPFVMTTKEQMAEAQRRYARGEMGYLGPYGG